jgi:imidazolonepropionase
MSSFRLYVSDAAEIVQVCARGERLKAGAAQGEVAVLQDASLVVGLDGTIACVGAAAEVAQWLHEQPQPVQFERQVDARGMVVLPGFVDAHTHPVWSGSRVNEFAMKLAGATYMEVHASGGGINNTVRHTRASSEQELAELLEKRLDRMLRAGTTLVEAKSGYGLEAETEIKMLRVLHSSAHPVEIVSNYLGGHSVPDGMTAAEATDDIVNKQIPALVKAKNEGTISPEFMCVLSLRSMLHAATHMCLHLM